jgi:hypothetical protein
MWMTNGERCYARWLHKGSLIESPYLFFGHDPLEILVLIFDAVPWPSIRFHWQIRQDGADILLLDNPATLWLLRLVMHVLIYPENVRHRLGPPIEQVQ